MGGGGIHSLAAGIITNMCEGESGVHSQGGMIRRREECRSLLGRNYGGTDHVPIQLSEMKLLNFNWCSRD
jgi:hypothetical protein